jgi:hypothetical protein
MPTAQTQSALLAEWGVILPFVTGLLSGFVSGPLLEAMKDYLGSRRSWLKQKTEIVQSLRLVMGQLHGFAGMCNAAFGERARSFPERIAPLQRCVMNYDLSGLKDRIARLAELHPKDISASGVSQQMVAYLSSTLAMFLAVQKIELDAKALVVRHGTFFGFKAI